MEQYILQLVEDFREAAKKAPGQDELLDIAGIDLPDELKDFADVELYLNGPRQKLSVILGIEKAALPPPEKLSDSQTIFLCDEMIRLLNAYHFFADFPRGLPVAIKYRLLLEKWESEQVLIGTGESHLEFCHYEPEECPFPGEYCECKGFLEEGDE